MTDEVEELLKVLGPFYELVDEKKKITQISDLSTGRFLSTLQKPLAYLKKRTFGSTFFLFVFGLRSARLTRFARQLEGKYPTVTMRRGG